MQLMTAKEAKNRFGELLDNAQKEPVFITKNNRLVGALVSIDDLKHTHFSDMYAEPEPGHSEWLKAKINEAVNLFERGGSQGISMEEAHEKAMRQAKERLGVSEE